jgi:uncharacterized protein YoxC
VSEPIFWLGVSMFLVALCLSFVLMTAIPAFKELARAARSAEKLFDTLHRELPPTLDAIRTTGLDIADLKDEISEGVDKTTRVISQVDQSLMEVRHQVKQTSVNTRSVWAGISATWNVLLRPSQTRKRTPSRATIPRHRQPPTE